MSKTEYRPGTLYGRIQPDTPLTPKEQKFIIEYVKCGSGVEAAKKAGMEHVSANTILKRPNVQKEIQRLMEEIRKENIATADEVMGYFTSVMRGEIKDQFGLDAPLSERTRAAQELAKRTVDIENRKAGLADQVTSITLNWERSDNDVSK